MAPWITQVSMKFGLRDIDLKLIINIPVTGDSAAERKRKRKSRWGGNENDKTFIPGMPTILPSTLDPAQQEAYLGNSLTPIAVDRLRSRN